eukprot:CAMPEP_0197450438 /NCGR_PEP_ID=MMETSP1175-20131217/25402_1 /TAXON_ID=1003142 /ORGANISM="Triceratium dubium, Strain CCMP147" /LENGTH=151 /DNA_ID=CAMNT_0042982863 /DNA_START=90 /DNA_END=545 /DNA_ORIENTATION=-
MTKVSAVLLLAVSLSVGNAASLGADNNRILATCGTCKDGNNPCEAGGEQLYFPYCDSRRRYVQCDEFGGCFRQRCGKGTRWSQDFKACVHKRCGECRNRCKAEDVAGGDYYRKHCSDETKYQQCDDFGGCFEMDCAPGTVWKNSLNVCVEA